MSAGRRAAAWEVDVNRLEHPWLTEKPPEGFTDPLLEAKVLEVGKRKEVTLPGVSPGARQRRTQTEVGRLRHICKLSEPRVERAEIHVTAPKHPLLWSGSLTDSEGADAARSISSLWHQQSLYKERCRRRAGHCEGDTGNSSCFSLCLAANRS